MNMRRSLLLLTLSLSLSLLAQVPAGYYDEAYGQKDAALKTALSLIIRGGVRYEYGVTTYHTTTQQGWQAGDLKAYGTWQAFPFTDCHADTTVWDMYSNTVRYFPEKLGESACALNIEHCFPKSWWGGEVNDAYKDLYHLNPSDQQANGQKSNYPPGRVQAGDKFDNGSFRMDKPASSANGWSCFEPAEVYRGDFARAYFYIATAYEDLTWATGTSPFDAANALDNSSYLEFKPWLVQVLLDWHRADPVSRKERERADAIYAIQQNRNPFIDYPDLVEYIWGDHKGQTPDWAALTCTADPAFEPAEDYTDFRAHTPSFTPDSTTATFTWSDFSHNHTYRLHLYTRSFTGHNDTLVSLPGISAAAGALPNGVTLTNGRANGSQSVTMGTSSNDGSLTLSGLSLSTDATLRFRASQYNTATSAQIDVKADGRLLTTVNPERSERWYELTIPAGTSSVTLTSVGGSTSKRACLQALYLYFGDWQEIQSPLEISPIDVTANTAELVLPEQFQGQTLYYYVTADNQTRSNHVAFRCPVRREMAVPSASYDAAPVARKLLRDGQVIIQRGTRFYTSLGLPLH